jgi:DNA replication and repair protein RecF
LKINKLQVKNFRNIKKLNYEPSPGLNIFVGNNAQGKTNLLESIFVLAAGNSFRRATDANLVNYEASGYAINGIYNIAERSIEASLHYQRNNKKEFVINNKKSNQNHKDRLRVVLFTPDDLFLIKGSPAKRRAFLDFILKQLSGEYYYNLDNYVNILKKRNLFLKREQTTGKSFKIINDLFIENAIRLIIQRINFVNILEEISKPIYLEINQAQNELNMRYALSFAIDNDKINMNVLQIALRQHIEEHLQEERFRRKTMVGPHLDDINFYQDGRLARIFASQGQQRNISISLKLAELYAFKKIKDCYPVFLLDEVLSELDEGKRKMLVRHLQQADFQTFLTAVNIDNIKENNDNNYIVSEGRLLRKEC